MQKQRKKKFNLTDMDANCDVRWEDLALDPAKTLGSGQFGKVYIADFLGTEVAVKEFFQNTDVDFDKYLSREVNLLKEARHPNVVQFIGVCLHNAQYYIVTEYVVGGSIRKWIEDHEKPFDWHLRTSFATDIARALAYLHSKSIIHRDLKGENLLITENRRVKVCDFGFSRKAATTDDEKKRLSYCGTDAYMAPEIILCIEFDHRIDIFSYGVILCELISRKLANDTTFQRQIPGFGLDDAELRSYAPADTPPHFVDLASQCVDADPDRRPTLKTILQMLREIEIQLPKIENIGILEDSLRHEMQAQAEPILQPNKRIKGGQAADIIITDSRNTQLDMQKYSDHKPTYNRKPVPMGSERRIGHNIPHRFTLHSFTSLAKCHFCNKMIGMPRKKYYVCDDCGFSFHPACADLTGPSCGLPPGLMTASLSSHPSPW